MAMYVQHYVLFRFISCCAIRKSLTGITPPGGLNSLETVRETSLPLKSPPPVSPSFPHQFFLGIDLLALSTIFSLSLPPPASPVATSFACSGNQNRPKSSPILLRISRNSNHHGKCQTIHINGLEVNIPLFWQDVGSLW